MTVIDKVLYFCKTAIVLYSSVVEIVNKVSGL